MARLEAVEGLFSFSFFLFFSTTERKEKKTFKKKLTPLSSPSFPSSPAPSFSSSLPPLHLQQITHTADYFGKLHDIAVDLIKRDRAYVCHQTQEQVKAAREAREGSPYRDRPVQESLDLFAEMTAGNVAEGAATLRLKMDPQNNNLNMFDPVSSGVLREIFSFWREEKS